MKRSTRELVIPFSIALILFVILKVFVFEFYVVRENSMRPALPQGTTILVVKAAYGLNNPFTGSRLFGFGTPRRNDIVVFRLGREHSLLIKRVVAVENDLVEEHQGRIMVNGRPLSGLPRVRHQGLFHTGKRIRIPAQTLFVLGDNLPASRDSREFGPIPAASVVGKAVLSLLPLPRFGPLE